MRSPQSVGDNLENAFGDGQHFGRVAPGEVGKVGGVARIDSPLLKPLQIDGVERVGISVRRQCDQHREVVGLAELDIGADEQRFERLLGRLLSMETSKAFREPGVGQQQAARRKIVSGELQPLERLRPLRHSLADTRIGLRGPANTGSSRRHRDDAPSRADR